MALNAASEDIRDLIIGAGFTPTFSLAWGSGTDGDEINAQNLVTDTEAIPSIITDENENPTFNIMVRGGVDESAKVAHDRARSLYEFLLQESSQTINGTEYLRFTPIGGLLPIGRDGNRRPVYTMNFYSYRCAVEI